jgi:hypothetical protein
LLLTFPETGPLDTMDIEDIIELPDDASEMLAYEAALE